jgi:hypothetical protein
MVGHDRGAIKFFATKGGRDMDQVIELVDTVEVVPT